MPARKIEDLDYVDGEVPWLWIGVYEAHQHYGGPEEGGWWYESGDLIEVWRADTEADAIDKADELREKYPRTGKRYSVIGGDDWDVRLSAGPPVRHYPEERPRYE
jgi:hypothetical protein